VSKIAELEREIAAEREAEARAEAEAAQAIKTAEAERRRAEAGLGKTIATAEKTATAVLATAAEVADRAPLPALGHRLMARRLQLGTLLQAPGDLGGPVGVVLREDGAAHLLYSTLEDTQRIRRDAEEQLGPDHPLTARADACECGLWRAFLARLRQVAGEDG
jgi:hypothetical protein